MPLQKIIVSYRSHLYLWHITETTNELLNLFSGEIPTGYLRWRSVAHQNQFLAKQLLLEHLHLDKQLDYLPSGKPVLRNREYISISHSGSFVALSVSQQEIGLDMESANSKLLKIAPKFVHPSEKKIFDTQKIEDLQYLWTAKESIYKLAGQKGLRFKQDILLQNFDPVQSSARVLLLKQREIIVFFNKISPDYLTAQAFYQ